MDNRMTEEKSAVADAPPAYYPSAPAPGVADTLRGVLAAEGGAWARDEAAEVFGDRCMAGVYVLDNSLSMEFGDGKVVRVGEDGRVSMMRGVSRWTEAVSKALLIYEYNLRRGMVSVFYLLNPRGATWTHGVDYLVVRPFASEEQRMADRRLFDGLCAESNVRGSTPLHAVTAYVAQNLRELRATSPISLGLITDGEPNDPRQFEEALRDLCRNFEVFLAVSLCTDNPQTVDYYNGLDHTLGRELSGIDVLDDFEAEAREIRDAGNDFFVYTPIIHTARMAGSSSRLADQLDEAPLLYGQAAALVTDILKLPKPNDTMHPENFLLMVHAALFGRPLAYDITRHHFRPQVDTAQLRNHLNGTPSTPFCTIL